jgi:hypothetical protein
MRKRSIAEFHSILTLLIMLPEVGLFARMSTLPKGRALRSERAVRTASSCEVKMDTDRRAKDIKKK